MKRRIFIIAIVTIAVTLSTVGIIVCYKRKQEAFQMEQIELYRGRLKKTEIADTFGFTNLIGADRNDTDGELPQFILRMTRRNLSSAVRMVERGEEVDVGRFFGSPTSRFGEDVHNYLLTYFEGREWFESTLGRSPGIDIHYTEVLMVHSEVEARGMSDVPDHVLVVFPRFEPNDGDTRRTTTQILRNLNATVQERGLNLAEYGLTYPITLENLIEDWEKVWDVCLALGVIDEEFYVIRTLDFVQVEE